MRTRGSKGDRKSVSHDSTAHNRHACTLISVFHREREGKEEGKGLTGHRVRAGHEVQRDGVGRVGGHALQVAFRDFVEAVRGGGHVFVHPVQERVHA